MAKVLRCKHIGPDTTCTYEARGETTEDILKQVAAHAGAVHGIKQVTPELVQKAQAETRDE
jgi:predicted small metal-binding protein